MWWKASSSEQTDLLILLHLITTSVWMCTGTPFVLCGTGQRGHSALKSLLPTDHLHLNSWTFTPLLWTPAAEALWCYTASSSLMHSSRFSATRASLISEGWSKNEAVPNYMLCLSESLWFQKLDNNPLIMLLNSCLITRDFLPATHPLTVP